MIGAVTQVDNHVKIEPATRAHEQGRDVGLKPRSVRADQHVGPQQVFLLVEKFSKPGDPVSSDVSMTTLTLKPSDPRSPITADMAIRLIRCWDLLSAVPRP